MTMSAPTGFSGVDRDKRMAWDGRRYDRKDWVKWYQQEGDEYFELAPHWRGLLAFARENSISKVFHCGKPYPVSFHPQWENACCCRCFGVLFACHLVILPVELRARISYFRPDSLPRNNEIKVGNDYCLGEMLIYDLNADVDYFLHVMQCPLWLNINFAAVASDMYYVVMDPCRRSRVIDQTPDDLPLYNFLGVDGLDVSVTCESMCTPVTLRAHRCRCSEPIAAGAAIVGN